jgi:hypothetical protein
LLFSVDGVSGPHALHPRKHKPRARHTHTKHIVAASAGAGTAVIAVFVAVRNPSSGQNLLGWCRSEKVKDEEVDPDSERGIYKPDNGLKPGPDPDEEKLDVKLETAPPSLSLMINYIASSWVPELR